MAGGRGGLEHGSSAAKPTGREARLADEIEDLTRALGEAHVELRALKPGGTASLGFADLEQLPSRAWAVGEPVLLGRRPARPHYYDRRARHQAGHQVRGPWPTPARARRASVHLAVAAATELLGQALIEDLTSPATGEVTPIFLVTENGPCFKSSGFARYIDSRPELTHVRTRRRSPQTNGVIERYHGAIKIGALWRELPADGAEMTRMVEDFRRLKNHVRPHETLAGDRPIDRYLTDHPPTPSPRFKRANMRGLLDAGQARTPSPRDQWYGQPPMGRCRGVGDDVAASVSSFIHRDV